MARAGRVFSGREHVGEAHTAGGRVVVGVVMHRDAGALEDRAVVIPGRVADPHLAGGEVALEEVGTDLERARAADGLDRGDAPGLERGMFRAEQQALHGGAVVGRAFHRQVGARQRGRGKCDLGLAHGAEQRNAAFFVVVQADAEIDLLRTRVVHEGFDEGEDGVAGIGVDVFEHGQAAPR